MPDFQLPVNICSIKITNVWNWIAQICECVNVRTPTTTATAAHHKILHNVNVIRMWILLFFEQKESDIRFSLVHKEYLFCAEKRCQFQTDRFNMFVFIFWFWNKRFNGLSSAFIYGSNVSFIWEKFDFHAIYFLPYALFLNAYILSRDKRPTL